MKAGIFSFGEGTSPHRGKRPKGALAQGASIIRNVCREAGFDVVDLCDFWQTVDVVMVSLFWWEHLYEMIQWVAAHGVQYRREARREKPILFVGGGLVSYNPSPVRDIADLVCVGDGEEVAPAVLRQLAAGAPLADLVAVPGVYVSSEDNQATWQQVRDVTATLRYPFHNTMNQPDDDSGVRQVRVAERRLEIARGCKSKCLYCGIGWTKAYRENSAEDIARVVAEAPGAVKAYAPDPHSHSGWEDIEGAFREAGKHNQARDLAAKTILSRGLGDTTGHTMGIDGLSERIRTAFAKPLSPDRLVGLLEEANTKVGAVGIYMILDAPGETDADYIEWFTTLARARFAPVRTVSAKNLKRGFTAERFSVVISLNAFCPTPGTPLQWAGIDPEARLTDRYLSFTHLLGPQEDRRLRHKLLGRAHGTASRVCEAAAMRGAPEVAPFIWTVASTRKRFGGPRALEDLRAVASRVGSLDALDRALAPQSTRTLTPWEQRVRPLFDRDVLLRAWSRYARRMGVKTDAPVRLTMANEPVLPESIGCVAAP